MFLSTKARKNFKEWYNSGDRRKELATKDDGLQTGYWPRKDSHILRVAMLLNTAEICGTAADWKRYRHDEGESLMDPLQELPPIQWRQIETAMAWLREIEAGRELCTREMGRSKRSQLPQKIRRMLERRKRNGGWAERLLIVRRMHRALGVGTEECDKALNLLMETQQVMRTGKGKAVSYKVKIEPGPYDADEAPTGSGPDMGEEHEPVEEPESEWQEEDGE